MKSSKQFKAVTTEAFKDNTEKLPRVSLLTTRLKREVEITLNTQEELKIIQNWARAYPEVLKIILEAKDNRIHCPFGTGCNEFPCKDLICNADCCSNGYVYRQS
jgi:hypothetical protein